MSISVPNCKCCQANTGGVKLFPGGPAFVGHFWQVEHAYPTSRLGWTILRLGRHCEALHELSAAEFEEKAKIEFQIVQFLREHTKCDKEYISCFSEAEGFKHIHVHIIPKLSASGIDDVGVLSFKHLKPEEKEIVPIETIQQFSNTLGAVLKRISD